jgi:hypothetical protein
MVHIYLLGNEYACRVSIFVCLTSHHSASPYHIPNGVRRPNMRLHNRNTNRAATSPLMSADGPDTYFRAEQNLTTWRKPPRTVPQQTPASLAIGGRRFRPPRSVLLAHPIAVGSLECLCSEDQSIRSDCTMWLLEMRPTRAAGSTRMRVPISVSDHCQYSALALEPGRRKQTFS